MLFQNPDSESISIVIILIIAVLILAIMLIATFVLLRSDAKPQNKISKDEVKTSLPVAVLDTLSEDGLKNEPKSSSLAGRFARLFPENGQKIHSKLIREP